MPELTGERLQKLERRVRDYLPGLALERDRDRVRVCHAWPADVAGVDDLALRGHDSYALTGWNRLFYETPLLERDTEDGGTEYAIELPPPSRLFSRFRDARDRAPGDLPREGVDARVDGGLFVRFHERIEECKLRANRLENGRYGDLQAEWSPESKHNQTLDQSADRLEAMTDSRKDAHMVDFRDVVGVNYWTLFTARHALVEGRYDHDSGSKLARETLGVADESQCAECDALLPSVELLAFNTYWLCDECGDNRNAPTAVRKARERRYDEYAGDLAREDWRDYGDEYEYSVRVSDHRPSEYSHNDEKELFVTVEQGGEQVSWFAEDREYMVERLCEHLQRRSERRIIAGRHIGPVPLEPETVAVDDDYAGVDLRATDVIPQASLGDFEPEPMPKGT